MFNKVATLLALVSLALSASVPCTTFQSSKLGTASNCTITRNDANSLSWSAIVHFSQDYQWKDSSHSNVLADMSSPRLPIAPSASKCETKAGSYSKGQTVSVSCTQGFDAIPTGYSNVITAFDGEDYPLGFSMKIPLSLIKRLPHLTQQ